MSVRYSRRHDPAAVTATRAPGDRGAAFQRDEDDDVHDRLDVERHDRISYQPSEATVNRGPVRQSYRMTTVLADLRFAVRGLRRSPLFSIVAILSLALGIGANTAIFTLIDQIAAAQAAGRAIPSSS